MSAGVTWLIEHKLLLVNTWGKVNVDELSAMDSRISDMLDNSQEPLVHGIHDHTRAESIPSAKDLMQVKAGKHPRVGWLIIVGLDNKLMKFFVSATGQVLNIRLRFMDTVEEALTFLQDIDSTLPDLKALDLTAADTRIHENAVSIEKAS
jgi:proteasome lid subunit RPN8/RPN11